MRVLHVVTRMNVGGVAELVLNLVGGLPEEGISVVLATGEVQDGEKEVAALPVDLVRVPGLGRSPHATDDLRALRALRRLVREDRPDVVHTHTAKAGLLGRIAAEGLRVPRVHTFHGHLLRGYFRPGMTRAVTAAEAALASRTDLLVSSGDRVGAELRAAGVGRSRRWVNIPPGIRPPRLSGVREKRTVAYVGRLVPVKRPDRLLAVARLLPDVRFLVAGDGPLRPALQAQSPSNVEWLGWTADVGTVYGRASAVLMCSDNEAMPLTLVEGAMCGLPAVTTDAGSAAEVVEHGFTGLVADASPQALAGALRTVLDVPDGGRAMGERARARALARFSVRTMTSAHSVAYRSLLA